MVCSILLVGVDASSLKTLLCKGYLWCIPPL